MKINQVPFVALIVAVTVTSISGCELSLSILFPDKQIEMILVEGGTFQMGEAGLAEPVHSVTLSSFLMSKYEVTQGQYQTVMSDNPSHFPGVLSRPVDQVAWAEAYEFCNALSVQEGLEEVYSFTETTLDGVLKNWLIMDMSKSGYRLPTEAEWEYAALGGNKSIGYIYAGSNELDAVGWHAGNSKDTTHPVGMKLPNELGLYDMSGNVAEWCWDFALNYQPEAQTNPIGGTNRWVYERIHRGGGYTLGGARIKERSYNKQSWDYIGFRIVKNP